MIDDLRRTANFVHFEIINRYCRNVRNKYQEDIMFENYAWRDEVLVLQI